MEPERHIGPDGEADPPEPGDPRLEIPEVLRTPVRKPEHYGTPRMGPSVADWGDTARAWGLALEFVFSTVGALVLGYLIDRWAGTTPRWSFIGLALGLVLAFVRIVRHTQRQQKDARK